MYLFTRRTKFAQFDILSLRDSTGENILRAGLPKLFESGTPAEEPLPPLSGVYEPIWFIGCTGVRPFYTNLWCVGVVDGCGV